MSQIKEINDKILSAINKENPFYQALWGKEDFTPAMNPLVPNDYDCGAICNQLEYLYQWIEEISKLELADIPEPYILTMIYFFVKLEKFNSETVESFLDRAFSLLVRDGKFRSTTWGTPWDILNVFSYYLDRESVYYIKNMVVTDIMVNGSFEDPISSEWSFTPAGDRSLNNAFIGAYKIDFAAIDTLSQDIAVSAGTYVLNWFAKCISPSGQMGVEIRRSSDGKYWDFDNLQWSLVTTQRVYTLDGDCQKYVNYDIHVVSEGSDTFTIRFNKIGSDVFYLDRVKFGLKEYPAFEILYVEVGGAEGFAAMWENETNPENASYLDQSYMLFSTGLQFGESFYDDLVKMLSAAGVYAEFTKEDRY